jgi:phosphoribosylglycinamide formyltransferase-1
MATPKLAVLISGGGRSLENLEDCIRAGELEAEIALVISSRESVGGLQRAERLGLESQVIDPRRELSPEGYSEAVFRAIESADCELVVLAGFLRFLPIPPEWDGRVLNIHPSLLPAFGGKGYYGDHVHRAVLERGVQFTGCTVHYVDNEYDHGRILLQRCIAVQPGESTESLASRVFEEEKIALPEAIRRHLSGSA